MYKRVSLILVALALFVVLGCSKAPDNEMKAGETAMQAAVAAEAEQYAPDAYRAAVDTMNAANAAKAEQDSKWSLFRKYGKAAELYASAEALAEKAATAAQEEKDKVRQEVADLIAQTDSTLANAAAAVAKAPRAKGSKADIELIKSDLASVQAAFSDARADFDRGQYLVARTKVQTVAERAAGLIAEVQKAKSRQAGK